MGSCQVASLPRGVEIDPLPRLAPLTGEVMAAASSRLAGVGAVELALARATSHWRNSWWGSWTSLRGARSGSASAAGKAMRGLDGPARPCRAPAARKSLWELRFAGPEIGSTRVAGLAGRFYGHYTYRRPTGPIRSRPVCSSWRSSSAGGAPVTSAPPGDRARGLSPPAPAVRRPRVVAAPPAACRACRAGASA